MPLASTFKIGAKGSKKSKNEKEWETLLNKNTSKLTETKTYNNTLLAALPKISAENTTHIVPTYFALSFCEYVFVLAILLVAAFNIYKFSLYHSIAAFYSSLETPVRIISQHLFRLADIRITVLNITGSIRSEFRLDVHTKRFR